MATAALIISIISAIFTGCGLYYARRQTNLAGEQAKYAREAIMLSRDRELEPKLRARVVEINAGINYKLELTSSGPKDYEEVLVTLPPKQGIRFTSSQYGVDSSQRGELLDAGGRKLVMAGSPLVWRVELANGEVPAGIMLRAKCRAGEDTWTVPVAIEDGISPAPWAMWA